MRNFLKATLSLAVILSLALAFGCGKKDNPTTPTNNTNTTAQQGYATQANGMNNLAIGFAGGFSSGLEGYHPGTTLSKLGLPGAYLAKADTAWHYYAGLHVNHFNASPGTSGWWNFTVVDTPLIRAWVRFSPDSIWFPTPPINVTRVDWEYHMVTDSGTAEYSAYVSENVDSTLDGGWFFGITGGASAVYWLYTFDNISTHGWDDPTRDCHGTINFVLNANSVNLLEGQLVFVNGVGTIDNCWVKLSSTTIIKYSFLANGTGNYYLAGESFATAHPFTW